MAQTDIQDLLPSPPGRRIADSLPDAGGGADTGFGSLTERIGHTVGRRWPFRSATIALERPIVSISFDDFPISAYTNGARILESCGVRGTFYVATGLLGMPTPLWTVAGADEVIDLHQRGHEIGLHSHGHRPAGSMRPSAFAADLAANRAGLRRLIPDLVHETYAYPYGLCSLHHKRHLSRSARACRSVQHGINAGRVDLDFVRAVEISARSLTTERLETLLDRTAAVSGWLVFFTHDVGETPSAYGTSLAMLSRIVGSVQARGMDILPVAAALDRMGIS